MELAKAPDQRPGVKPVHTLGMLDYPPGGTSNSAALALCRTLSADHAPLPSSCRKLGPPMRPAWHGRCNSLQGQAQPHVWV